MKKIENLTPIIKLEEANGRRAELVRVFADRLTHNHADLGRQGAICPHAKTALNGHMYVREFIPPIPTSVDIKRMMARSLKDFLRIEDFSLHKVLITMFSEHLGSSVLKEFDRVQEELKIHFISRKLMLGVFHAEEDSTGLHSDSFEPFRCPVPLIVVRNMVPGDKPFFIKGVESARSRLDRAEDLLDLHHGFFPAAYPDPPTRGGG
jgi:hypothetical protein